MLKTQVAWASSGTGREDRDALRVDLPCNARRGQLRRVHTHRRPAARPWYAVHHGYEVQIWLPATNGADGLHLLLSRAEAQAQRPRRVERWDPRCRGTLVEVTLNGVHNHHIRSGRAGRPCRGLRAGRGPRPEHGYVGLQNHDSDSMVYFREVSVEALP
jgi:hypothetical protein